MYLSGRGKKNSKMPNIKKIPMQNKKITLRSLKYSVLFDITRYIRCYSSTMSDSKFNPRLTWGLKLGSVQSVGDGQMETRPEFRLRLRPSIDIRQ